jgi:hypothetical protein
MSSTKLFFSEVSSSETDDLSLSANRLLIELLLTRNEALDSVLKVICRAISTPPEEVFQTLRLITSQVDISCFGDCSKRHQIETELSVSFPFSSDVDKLSETLRSCNVQFVPPVETLVIGAYSIGAGIRLPIKSFLHNSRTENFTHAFNLDILAVVPRSFFSKRDYLDYRYTRKRAFYLAAIAAILKCNHSLASLISNLRYSFHRGNSLHPILLFDLADSFLGEFGNAPIQTKLHSTRFTVCVHLGTEAGLFSESRFRSDVCNLRRRARKSGDLSLSARGSQNVVTNVSAPQSKRAKTEPEAELASSEAVDTAHEHSLEPDREEWQHSPLYNASLIADMQRLEEHERLVRAVDSYPQLRRALALLQLWLHSSPRPTRSWTGLNWEDIIRFIIEHLSDNRLNLSADPLSVFRSILLLLGIFLLFLHL